jgi:protein-tyrosine phosphatase
LIDLHCHMLPGIDDGAGNLDVSLRMARAAVEQGITVVACTPHILPGLYHNKGPAIRQAIKQLQDALDENGIALQLTTGADVHMAPDFVAGLRSGQLLSIADSRYVLVEPPHHIAPPHIEEFFFNLVAAGYVPVLTHPERLSWLPQRHEAIGRLVRAGVWMQITAGSFAGAFGRNALYWAERLLDEGSVHLIATDAHDAERRPPDLARGRDIVAKRAGPAEAERLVVTRPLAVLQDQPPSSVPGPWGARGVMNAESGSHRRQAEPGDDGTGSAALDRGGFSLSRRLRRFFRQ